MRGRARRSERDLAECGDAAERGNLADRGDAERDRSPAVAPPSGGRLPLRHAILLGLVQGPTELLPVSSSAHTTLIPHFAGWPAAELDADARNALEVALHAGTAAALLLAWRREGARTLRELCPQKLPPLALALAPPALVGYVFERQIERRPSTPRSIAAGLALGGAAMAWADGRAQVRSAAEAGPGDGLALGLAQAFALLPGVSRNGATLTAARLRGFSRGDAQALSWRVGVPLLLGATALKARGLAQRGAPAGTVPALAAGAVAAFLSTLASSPLLAPGRRRGALLPYALYRGGLAAVVLRRA